MGDQSKTKVSADPSLLSRRQFTQMSAIGMLLTWSDLAVLRGGESPGRFALDTGKGIIPAPDEPEQWPQYRRQLATWRETQREKLAYDDALYRQQKFSWTAEDFSCCFLMMCDEQFYDPVSSEYRVQQFLERGERQFGGYDSVVLWHAYPRIGLDNRNQFDFYRDMPGGIIGLRTVVDRLHQAGVRAFVDYNPWDTGTHREGRADLDVLCDFVRDLDADGIFLDTMAEGAVDARAKLDAARPGVALESELALAVDRVHDHHLSWAQWFQDSPVPGVLRNKWFERRHMQHQIHRWSTDHTGELQSAWMNGSGMMIWENVFGSWVGWSERDRSMLRTMRAIQRKFVALWTTEQWTPLVPTLQKDVFASLWEANGLKLWTLVNRSSQDVAGPLLALPRTKEQRCYDLVRGTEVVQQDMVQGSLDPRGIGCFVVARPSELGSDFAQFLANQKLLAQRSSRDASFPAVKTRLVPIQPTRRAAREPSGMARIKAGKVTLTSQLRARECGYYESAPADGHHPPFSYEYRAESFTREVSLGDYAMDLTPVTNAQFAEFLRATGYRPKHGRHFLEHWQGDTPPRDQSDHPVVYLDLEDARAYARWAGKRLPTEEEWQYAAAGPQQLRYPWGNEMLAGRCNTGDAGTTTPVTGYPEGRSPFGILDLCGNVWEWTESQRSDGHTRFCIIKGGSYYSAQGSNWYMDGGPRENSFAAKFLLMWPGLDRCATVGFRCVVDLE